MPLSKGQILKDRYRILTLLGEGGFGAVYQVWDLNMECPRALKENLDTSPEAQKQFKLEAKILGLLKHQNLPNVIDHFVIPGQGQYLVMEYVEGKDLREMLEEQDEPLPERQVLPWIQQICNALTYLHDQSPPVIHRDIKPANIKITPQGQAVLVDFGIAKIFDAQLKTTVGAQAVTPGFSPPEQYGRGRTDARTDIYALGATLYALFTKIEPPDSVDIIAGSELPPVEVNSLNPEVSSQVSAAINRAMQLDRGDRFQTVGEFQSALLALTMVVQPSSKNEASIPYETQILSEEQDTGMDKTHKKHRLSPSIYIMLAIPLLVLVILLSLRLRPIRGWLVTQIRGNWTPVREVVNPPGLDQIPEDQVLSEDQAPRFERFDVPLDDDPILGPIRAPITIVEFGDFQCEDCRFWFFEIYPRLEGAYGEVIRLVFRDFPQEWIHPEALPAALAANCALEQERYWEYHERLLSWEHELGLPGYYIYAEQLQMGLDAFSFCFESGRFQEEIQRDLESADRLGVERAPTFFINGIRFDGPGTFEDFARIIEMELSQGP
jgi:serine/threonine protein kinase/protein-disulfide isomerase